MIVAGQMSGTSLDGIDTVLAEVTGSGLGLEFSVIDRRSDPFPETLREKLQLAASGQPISLPEQCEVEFELARVYGSIVRKLEREPELLGCHGQTVFHLPPNAENLGYSVQWVHGPTLAKVAGCPVVVNFRQADLAEGGQGAPIVPRVDAALLASAAEVRATLNLGGIANLTYLPKASGDWINEVLGWDTGPANSLIDLVVTKLTSGQKQFDEDGELARRGRVNDSLLSDWLREDYFSPPPPKSTGREKFGWAWLEAQRLDQMGVEDWCATLTEFTARSVARSVENFCPQRPARILVGGGGAKNSFLLQRLSANLPDLSIELTSAYGVESEWKEALAMANLAYWRVHHQPGNLPSVTGAHREVPLGELYYPR